MDNMLKLFKKKKEPVIEKHEFLANIYTRHMGKLEIVGYYESAKDLATRLSYLIDNFNSFTCDNKDGNSIVILSKYVEFIEVDGEPYEA
jgi:hypothetical protein